MRRGGECTRGLLRISRTNHIELRNDAQPAHGLDRFVRRAIFADADGVVGEDVDVGQLRERGEPDRRAAVIREDEKRGAGGAEDSVVTDAVHDRAHAVLADAEVDVPALAVVAREIFAAFDVVQGRAVQIGAAADEKRHRLRERLERFAPGLARGDLRVGRE